MTHELSSGIQSFGVACPVCSLIQPSIQSPLLGFLPKPHLHRDATRTPLVRNGTQACAALRSSCGSVTAQSSG